MKMASSKRNWYNPAVLCPVNVLVSVIVNEAVSSGLYAAIPALAAQGSTVISYLIPDSYRLCYEN